MHPAGRAFPSGWSTNSLMTVIYEKTLLVLLWIEKMFSQTAIIKLFTDQSEVSVVPVLCFA